MIDLATHIKEALDRASVSGYTFEDWTPEEISADLAQYDPELESYEPETLLPFVEAWFKR